MCINCGMCVDNCPQGALSMDQEGKVTYEQWKEYMERYEKEKAEAPADTWAGMYLEWAELEGVMSNDRPQSPVKREEAAAMARAVVKIIVDAMKELIYK